MTDDPVHRRKQLIEGAIPLEAIHAASARDKPGRGIGEQRAHERPHALPSLPAGTHPSQVQITITVAP